jgi:ribose/xylose/arabinose/galactoside ABC-type transport system permease subunit
MPMGIAWNAALARLASWFRPIKRKTDFSSATEMIKRLGIVCRDADQPVRELSGGNQQKVVLGKWLETGPSVLILDEPTRGVDVGAKAEVHRVIGELAAAGKAILLVSSDLPELLKLSDRVLVMRRGRLVAELPKQEATEQSVMMAAAGGEEVREQAAERKGSRFDRLALLRESAVVVLCVLLGGAAAMREHRFLDPINLEAILLWVPLLAVVGLGQMLVIVTRGIDVSVGSMVGLSAMVVGMSFRAEPHLPLLVGVAIGMVLGALLGALNGSLVSAARIPPIIVTLGTLSLFRGATFIVSRGRQIDSYDIPDALTRWSSAGPFTIGGVTVPWILLLILALAAFWSWGVKKTRIGRNVFAFGSNPEAAELRGLRTRRTNFGVYAATGALCGLAGVLYASRYGFVNPGTAGAGLELIVIAAVVIGGTNVLGGSGTVSGVLLGCLFLAILNQGLAVLGIAENWQQLVYGGVILVAVLLDSGLRTLTSGKRTGVI